MCESAGRVANRPDTGGSGQEQALATTLVDAGYDPVEIAAAAALHAWRGGENQQ